jgi:hypothetical protein
MATRTAVPQCTHVRHARTRHLSVVVCLFRRTMAAMTTTMMVMMMRLLLRWMAVVRALY